MLSFITSAGGRFSCCFDIKSNTVLYPHITRQNVSHICWIYFTYPCGKEPRRECLERGGSFRKQKKGEDDWANLLSVTFKANKWDFYCRLSQAATVWCLPGVKSNITQIISGKDIFFHWGNPSVLSSLRLLMRKCRYCSIHSHFFDGIYSWVLLMVFMASMLYLSIKKVSDWSSVRWMREISVALQG